MPATCRRWAWSWQHEISYDNSNKWLWYGNFHGLRIAESEGRWMNSGVKTVFTLDSCLSTMLSIWFWLLTGGHQSTICTLHFTILICLQTIAPYLPDLLSLNPGFLYLSCLINRLQVGTISTILTIAYIFWFTLSHNTITLSPCSSSQSMYLVLFRVMWATCLCYSLHINDYNMT